MIRAVALKAYSQASAMSIGKAFNAKTLGTSFNQVGTFFLHARPPVVDVKSQYSGSIRQMAVDGQ